MRARRARRDVFVTGAAALGALCLVLAVAGAVLHARPLVFRSGSMSPTISTGSLAVVHRVPAASLQVGDVVTVRTSAGSVVTHRVVQLTASPDHATIQLQGDANPAPDPELHEVASVERVVFAAPWLGYVVGWLEGPGGLALLALYGVALARRVVRGTPRPQARVPRHRTAAAPHRRRGLVRGAAAVVVTLAATAGLVLGPAQRVWAAPWTDSVPVSGTVLTANVVPPPATFTCGAVGVLSVTFNWTAVSGATSYTLHTGTGGATTQTVVGTTATVTSALSSGTAWAQANINYGSTTWTSLASATRSYTVAVVSLCS